MVQFIDVTAPLRNTLSELGQTLERRNDPAKKLQELQIQQEQKKMEKIALGDKEIQKEIALNPEMDLTMAKIRALSRIDPQRALDEENKVFDQGLKIAKFDPKSAVDLVNSKLGTSFKYAGKEGKLHRIEDKQAGKVYFYDFERNDREPIRTIDITPEKKGGQALFSEPEIDSAGNIIQRNINTNEVKVISRPHKGFTFEQLPGGGFKLTEGPISRKEKKEEEKEVARRKKKETSAKVVVDKVDQAIEQTGVFTTGFFGQVLRGVGGTGAFDLDKTVDTIKAVLGFQELQEMREFSKTGGALGQVAVRELELLQSTIASLDTAQSEESLKRSLLEVKDRYSKVKNMLNRIESGETEIEENVFETLPESAEFIGKEKGTGKKVYRLPDGTQIIED